MLAAERENVAVISSNRMVGRLTRLARHLRDPAEKVVFATMEEEFYELDLNLFS